MRPRIVLYTNVLISALGWRGAPHEIVKRSLQGDFRLLLSPALLEELQRVLAYPKFRFSSDDISQFLAVLTEAADLVFPSRSFSIVEADPADDRVLECAVGGQVDFIVSGDPHLKELRIFEGIPILSPKDFLVGHPAPREP